VEDSNSDAAEVIIETAQKMTEEIKTSKERSAEEMSDAITGIKNRNRTIKKSIQESAASIMAEIGKLG